jgi:signal peptidase I
MVVSLILKTRADWLDPAFVMRSLAMKFLMTGTIALAAATAAQGAEIQRIGGDISIIGTITSGDAAKFKAIAANGTATVVLNSPGGYVAEAALISIQIRSQNYATRVPRRAKCESACVLIWLAGIRRELEMSYVNYEKAKAWGLLDPPPTPKPAAAKSDLSSASVREHKPAYFKLLSGSMLPTVPEGGLVLVIPTQQLRIGDVVAFYLPKDNSTTFVKRIVGMGGDQIQMIDGVLYINGQAVNRQRVEDYISAEKDGKPIKRWRETLPNGVSYMTLDLIDSGFYDNTPVYRVPVGHYFMMGDNRDNSTDSRVLSQVGYVPVENITGKARFVRLPEALN